MQSRQRRHVTRVRIVSMPCVEDTRLWKTTSQCLIWAKNNVVVKHCVNLMICFVRTNSSCTWRRLLPPRRWKTRRKNGRVFVCSRRQPRLNWRIVNSCLVTLWLVIKRLKSFKFVLFFLKEIQIYFLIIFFLYNCDLKGLIKRCTEVADEQHTKMVQVWSILNKLFRKNQKFEK